MCAGRWGRRRGGALFALARLDHSRARRHALHLRPMKQRAAKKKQTKKVKAAKAKAKAARRAAAAAEGDKDGDVGMDVAAADEDVMIAEAEAEAKPTGRAAHALRVQARRALKTKLSSLKNARQKIAKKNLSLKPERKAIGAAIKGLLSGQELAAAAADAPEDDDEWDEDVQMGE